MKSKDVLRLLQITRPTLTKYVKEQKVKITRQVNGQYDYDEQSIFDLMNRNTSRKNVFYARVSTSAQKADLDNQKDTLREFINKNGIILHHEYSDIASGMHFDRKDFEKMMSSVIDYQIQTIYITYKDRLARLSFDMIEKLFLKYGVNIVVLNEIDNPKLVEKEIFEDLMSIIHSFSMKMYSKRRKEKLELIKKDMDLENKIKKI